MEPKQQKGMIVLVVIAVLFGALSFMNPVGKIDTIQGSWDISSQVKANGFEKYLVEESDFDYTATNVWNAAQAVKSKTASAESAIKETARYVAQNVKYSGLISIDYCYSETASSVLSSRQGDCVSMSRLVTAMLRAQGIPARTMGGCLTSKRCGILFATVPGLQPFYMPMVDGDFKKRGFLHEYVEAWEPSRGWVRVEATSGQIFPMECVAYLNYGYDSNQYNRCTINDASFWDQCSIA